MASIFDKVAFNKIKSSSFDLSHDLKMSFKMGHMIPTVVMECMPGDRFDIQVQNFLRFAPLIAPVMHKVEVKTHFFFVPNRLLWSSWEDWVTDKDDIQHPTFNLGQGSAGTVPVKSVGDYLGIPVGEYEELVPCNPMPLAAYDLIYDEYFRNQQLQTEVFTPLTNGYNAAYEGKCVAAPKRANWRRDYLTSALPTAQMGDSVQLPLTFANDIAVDFSASDEPGIIRQPDGTLMGGPATLTSAATSSNLQAGGFDAVYDPNGSLTVDIQSAATDIETLRTAWTIQGWLERMIRGGTRYFEQIGSMFGVKSPDARLQRPEFIGGSYQEMVISEVMATAQSSNDSETAQVAVGTMAGHGISVGGGNNLHYNVQEHGWIIGIITVRPRTAYQDGLHRKFGRFDKFEYPWPQFANLGEQEVKQWEVRARVEAGTDPQRIFGYQSRYAEMKHENNRVAGEMRTTLDYWHFGRKFETTADPELTSNFVICNPTTRVFAVTDAEADHIYSHIFCNINAVRKLPRFGIPWVPQ